jgi:MFS transporter, DHA1 family, multidrug resistance protein
LLSLVMLVFGVSPILAPLTGSALTIAFGWRAVFAAVTFAALIGLALVTISLPETRPAHEREGASLANIMGAFQQLLTDWRFLRISLIGALGMASFLVLLSMSSFVFIGHFGLTPTQYSLCFSVIAIGFIASTQLAAPLGASALSEGPRQRSLSLPASRWSCLPLLRPASTICGS